MMKKITNLKSLLLAAALCVGGSAWGTTTTYDFYTWVKTNKTTNGESQSLTVTGNDIATADNATVKVISDIASPAFAFDGRFATDDTGNVMLRCGNSSNNQHEVNKGIQSKAANKHFSILNLNIGDIVTIVTGSGTTTFASTNCTVGGSAVHLGDRVGSNVDGTEVGATTVCTMTANGNLDLKLAQWAIIMSVSIQSESENVTLPSIALKSVNGKKRTVTITGGTSSASNTVTTYYTIDGTTPTTSSPSFTTATKDVEIGEGAETATDITVKAYTVSSASVASNVTSETFAVGTTIALGAVSFTFDKLTAGASSTYNPTYKVSVANPALGTPSSISLTATLNGNAVSLTDNAYTFTSAGTLEVTASADGYEPSSNQITVNKNSYIITKDVNFTTALTYRGTGTSEWNKAHGNTTYYTEGITNGTVIEGLTLTNTYLCSGNSDGSDVKGLGARVNTNATIAFTLTDGQIAMFKSEKEYGEHYHLYTNGSETYTMTQWDVLDHCYIYSPASQSVTVTDAGFATYVSTYNLDFTSSAIKAYTVNVTEKGKAVLTQINKVQAGVPVLLYKDGGATEDIPVCADYDTPGTNLLLAGTGDKVATIDGTYTNMILNNVSGIGFYYANDQIVATNRAYLHIATSLSPASTSRMSFVFADETTGISTAKTAEKANDEVYNLAGQRVAAPQKGLYIVNGKKVVIK